MKAQILLLMVLLVAVAWSRAISQQPTQDSSQEVVAAEAEESAAEEPASSNTETVPEAAAEQLSVREEILVRSAEAGDRRDVEGAEVDVERSRAEGSRANDQADVCAHTEVAIERGLRCDSSVVWRRGV